MQTEVAQALKREFGYVPLEEEGEKWIVYQDRALIVVHPERRPRIYRRGDCGAYSEIEPVW